MFCSNSGHRHLHPRRDSNNGKGRTGSALYLLLATLCSLLLVAPDTARAGPPVEEDPSSATPEADADSTNDPTRQRAQQILDLMQGELDLTVEATELFEIDFSNEEYATATAERLKRWLEPPDEPRRKKRREPAAEKVTLPQEASSSEALFFALDAFFRLPMTERRRVLADHRLRREAYANDQQIRRERLEEIERVQQRAQWLESYLDESLDPSVDPTTLLRVDLSDEREIMLSASRREAWMDDTSDTQAGENDATPPIEPGSQDALDAAYRSLDEARRHYFALTPEQRDELRSIHERAVDEALEAERIEKAEREASEAEADRPTEEEVEAEKAASEAEIAAERAAAEKAAALEQAKAAQTEAKRFLAEEQARLLGVKEAQARFEAELNRRRTQRAENRERSLEWSRKVAELADSAMFRSEKAAQADPMYEELRAELGSMRKLLASELERLRNAGDEVPTAGASPNANLPADMQSEELEQLRRSLDEDHDRLRALELDVMWDIAEGLRDDVVLLNQTRLSLLDLASPRLRRSVTGFGSSGVDQVQRELNQISLELRFQRLKLNRARQNTLATLRNVSVPLVLGLAKFLAVGFAYFWWRRRGDEMLGMVEAAVSERWGETAWGRMIETALWYIRRVRGPLEALAALWIFTELLGDGQRVLEFRLLWIVALWVLLGWSVVLYVDALAARDKMFASTTQEDTSSLRIHSLRIVGLNVISVGLILALTRAMVGRGAIHSWVISTCWLLSVPVVIYLLSRWKPHIFAALEAKVEKGPVATWALSRREGVMGFVSAAVGAGVLFAGGLSAWTLRQLSGLELTRRVLAYLFRREVAKHAAAIEADERFEHVGAEVYDAFDPEIIPTGLIAQVAGDELESVYATITSPRATLTAVVGERGSGKSAFLGALTERLGTDRILTVTCPEEGFDALCGRIGHLLGDTSLRDEALREALRARGPVIIAVDDVQRLVVPAVRGLKQLDQFTEMARNVGGGVSWVVTVGAAAWHYVLRARGESVFFEQVVTLPRWSEEQLGALIEQRCADANIDPSFEGLVVPRQSQVPLEPNEQHRSEAGYYRLLWDHSRGNPAVALHAFRESLFATPEDVIVVRLYKEPSQQEIEELPMPIVFVLRAIVQLEVAISREVEAATQFPSADVDDAMRFCIARGYLEPHDGGYRVTWPWYRTITSVLHRQHLLPSL